MKVLPLLASILILFTFDSCQKEPVFSLEKSFNKSFIDSAIEYLKASLSFDEFEKLDLSSGVPLIYQKTYIGLKISEKDSNDDSFILLRKNEKSFSGNRVSLVDKESLISQAHNGAIKLESLDRKLGTLLTISNNKVIKRKVSALATYLNGGGITSTLQHKAEKYELPEIIVISYVDRGNVVVYWSLYSLYNDNGAGTEGLYTTLVNSGSGGGSGSSTGDEPIDNVSATAIFRTPKKPIASVKNELKCFTAISSSSYKISVNINQPYPETRVLLNAYSEFMVGHTFLTLEQMNADGSSIVRNVGFYPQNGVKPGSTIDKSVFGDDSETPFDVSLQITVSANDFLTVINTLSLYQSFDYDLDNFNCTNAAIDALSSININLPSTQSNGPLFGGNDPADLGEDIRNLNLDEFSSANGNRTMIKTAGEVNDQKPRKRSGGC